MQLNQVRSRYLLPACGFGALVISLLSAMQLPLIAGKSSVHHAARKQGGIAATASKGDIWIAKYQDTDGPQKKLLWKKQLGATKADKSFGIASDSGGNVVIVGETKGSLGGSKQGGTDAWIAKYAPTGTLIWKTQLGSAANDAATGVATDSKGNILISGKTAGSLEGRSQGHDDAWVAKYTDDGKLVWKKQLGSKTDDHANGVSVDGSGNVFIAGDTDGAVGGKNQGVTDAWLAKYSKDGALVWKRQQGSVAMDDAKGVAIDRTGNVFITGQTYGSLGGPNKGFGDGWIAKYTPDGSLAWTKQIGSSATDYADGIAISSAGDIVIAGYGAGEMGSKRMGNVDAWVAKYSPKGGLLWKKQLGSASYDTGNGVATDSTGNVFTMGSTGGKLGGAASNGGSDSWVAKYSPDGSRGWVKQEGTARDDLAYAIATDGNGGVIVTGNSDG